jgi:hypothetical protein
MKKIGHSNSDHIAIHDVGKCNRSVKKDDHDAQRNNP